MGEMPVWLAIALSVAGAFGIAPMIAKGLVRRLQAGEEAAQVERLSSKFATVETMNHYRQSIDSQLQSLEKRAELTNSTAERAMDIASRAEADVREQARQLENYHGQMIREALEPLKDFRKTVELMDKNLAVNTAMTERLLKEFDNWRQAR